jgi:hypothetical protein
MTPFRRCRNGGELVVAGMRTIEDNRSTSMRFRPEIVSEIVALAGKLKTTADDDSCLMT